MNTPSPITRSLAYTKIAFSAAVGPHSRLEIFVMNPDGADQTRLTFTTAHNDRPAWSPDGRRIAYVFGDSHSQVYVMNADGANPTPLTNRTASHGPPSYSPDGTKIALSYHHTGQPPAIYVMNADGSGERQLTHGRDREPCWSPDGTKIVFISRRNGHEALELYVMNADGSNQTRLTFTTANNWHPSWSPDGAKIAFTSNRSGNRELYAMNADGADQRRLTFTAARNWNPSWSPDGAKIAFVSDRDGCSAIYVMNADGSDQTRLTYDPSDKSHLAWSPFLSDMIPNTLKFSDVFASPGEQALVPMYLHTNQPLSRLQFAVQPTVNGMPAAEARFSGLINNMAHAGLLTSFASDPEGATTVLLFSANDITLPPGTHVPLHLAYDLSPDAAAGLRIHLHVTDDILSSPARKAMPHTLQTGVISVGRPGDLTGGPFDRGDGRVDAADVRAAVDILLGKRSFPVHGALEFFLADVNGDGAIDILDVVEIVDLGLEGALKRRLDRPLEPTGIGLGPVIRLPSGQAALTVALASDSLLTGLQMRITYTCTQLQLEAPQSVGQASRMEVGYHITEESATEPAPIGTLRIVLYSPTGQGIMPGRGPILIIPATVLREPGPVYPEDTVDLLGLTRGSTCQAQQVSPNLIEAAWMTVSALPFRTTLLTAQQNPFRHVTQILYEVASPEQVVVAIHTVQGEEIVRMVDERQGPGRYGVRWYGKDARGDQAPPGEYLCRMTIRNGCSEIPLQRV